VGSGPGSGTWDSCRNWRTGELLPWDEAPIPNPPPTAVPTTSPDLGAAPLYEDPQGRYALYVGAAGQGLWCVPAAGPPVSWVQGGHHFVDIP
jgi:hypothetical protein